VGGGPYFSPAWSRQRALAEFCLSNCLPLSLRMGILILSDVAVQELKLDFYMLVTYFNSIGWSDEPMQSIKDILLELLLEELTIQQWSGTRSQREFHASSQTRCAARARERAHER